MNRFLDYKTYLNKVRELNDDYWNKSFDGRWVYMEPVVKELESMTPESAIELGSYKISLMSFSDNMGLDEKFFDPYNINNNNYVFDAKKTPWPIDNKQYDVFVALQVLEHLSPNQSDVFNEIKRISKKCILTLPYKWNAPGDRNHHNITDEIIQGWTNQEIPYKKIVLGKNKNRLRVMLCFNFD